MNVILYDFKRLFFRPSVLSFIVIFALSGIGLSYLVAQSISPQTTNISVIGVAIKENSTIKIIGITLDNNAKGIPNAKVYISNGKTIINTTITNSSGYFTSSFILSSTSPLTINVTSDLGKTSLEIIPTSTVFGKPSSFTYGSTFLTVIGTISSQFSGPTPNGGILINIDKHKNTGTIVVATIGDLLNSKSSKPDYDVYYTTVAPITSSSGFGTVTTYPSPENVTYTYLGRMTNYISFFNVNINPSHDLIYLKFKNRNNNVSFYHSFRYSFASPAENSIVTSMIVSLSPFAQFFPVIFLYLVYAMVAKPRSTGALEFLLARPVTRKEIYMNRYIAGILTALVSSGILIIAMYASMNILIGKTLDIYDFLLLYLGISGSLIAFYSLMYGMSTLRSATYLGIAIGFYMLFYIFWGVIGIFLAIGTKSNFSDILYMTYYFNPNGLYNFVVYFIQNNYGVSMLKTTAINSTAVIFSSLIWIIVPTILGYLRFKKINLSS